MALLPSRTNSSQTAHDPPAAAEWLCGLQPHKSALWASGLPLESGDHPSAHLPAVGRKNQVNTCEGLSCGGQAGLRMAVLTPTLHRSFHSLSSSPKPRVTQKGANESRPVVAQGVRMITLKAGFCVRTKGRPAPELRLHREDNTGFTESSSGKQKD